MYPMPPIKQRIDYSVLIYAFLFANLSDFFCLLRSVSAMPYIDLNRATPSKCIFAAMPLEAFVDIHYDILGANPVKSAEDDALLRVGITHLEVAGEEDKGKEDYYYNPESHTRDRSKNSKELIHMLTNSNGVLEYQSPAEGQVRICLSLTKSILHDSSFSGELMIALRVTERVDMLIDEGEYEANRKGNSLLFPEVDLTQMTPEDAKKLQERRAQLRKALMDRERLDLKSDLKDHVHELLSKHVLVNKHDTVNSHKEALEQFHLVQSTARSHFSELETLLLKFVEQSEMLITSSQLMRKEEDTFQERNREMNAASRWWPMIHVCVLIVTGFTQANHVVKFFKSKYIL